MPFLAVENCILSELRYTANGQKVENTLWFEDSDPPTVERIGVLNDLLFDWWETNVAPLQSEGVELREIYSSDQSSPTGPVGTLVPAEPAFGTNTPNIEPGSVTMAVSFRTAMRGRSFRGRNYVIGLTEDQVTGNDFAAGVVASWQAAYALLIPAALAEGFRWVVVSRFSGIDPDTGDPILRELGLHTPVVAVSVTDNFVDSQRRRLTTRGQ